MAVQRVLVAVVKVLPPVRKFFYILGCVLLFEACTAYSTYDEMASAMCQGRATDIQWNAWDEDAILVDVRSEDEFNVSHLAGALHCPWRGGELVGHEHLPTDRTIVLYCSVGKRSERAAEFLLDVGYTKVYNLYGGLFQSFNASQAIDQNQQVMQRIHGYSARWGKWITRGEVVYE
ncbi:MAG: hypothetical protein RLZZ262_2249 [Bacteroidota bacterium]|jgi:rhodanese-related sulfurtransferase